MQDVSFAERPTEILHTYNDGKKAVEEATDQQILHVQRCKVCERPTLATYRYIDGWSDPSDYMDFTYIYPPRRDVGDLPQRVGSRYTAMLELMHAPDVFAVRAGKLLEAVCSDQGLTKRDGDLSERLDKLVKSEKVPKPLTEQAHLVRRFRNVGGHDDDAEVELEDVPLLREFVEALLDYLYWGPLKLERGRKALARRLGRSES